MIPPLTTHGVDTGRPPPSTKEAWLLVALGLTCTALALGLCLGPLDAMPHVTDEVAYSLQAINFSHLRLWGRAPASASMAIYPFVAAAPGFHGVFPPGWPLLLAGATALGVPWLLNPLLASLLPWLTWRLARQTTGPATALPAAAFIAFSPGVLILAASRMSHTSTLVALLLLALVATAHRHDLAGGVTGGAALAYVVLARPFDAVLVGTVMGVALLWRRPPLRFWAGFLGLPSLAALLVLLYNHALTGSAATFPASLWFDGFFPNRPGCNRLGFGPDVGCVEVLQGSAGYTLKKGLVNLLHNTLTFDRLLLGVPTGGLLAAVGLALRRRALFLALLLFVPLGYLLYWSPGVAYGARFYHPLYVVAPIGLAALLVRVPSRMIWASLLIPLVGIWRAAGELGESYWCVDNSFTTMLDEHGIHDGVVFLDSKGQRTVSWPFLGVPALICDPLLEAGDAFGSVGFEGDQAPVVRHMPADLHQALDYMWQVHPGEDAWVVQHLVAADRRRLLHLDMENARLEEAPGAPGPQVLPTPARTPLKR